MDRVSWWVTVHEVTNGHNWAEHTHTHTHTHTQSLGVHSIEETSLQRGHKLTYNVFPICLMALHFMSPFSTWPILYHTSPSVKCLCVCSQLCPILCYPMDYSPSGLLPMEFFRQEYWSGLPFPPAGDLPHPGIEPESLASPALAGRFITIASPINGLI